MPSNQGDESTHGTFFSSTTSPFARKVRIAILLRGIEGHFDEVDCDPFLDAPAFIQANPIGQIPAFLTADGEGIFGSALMCAYLDTIGDSPPIATVGHASWDALRRQAMADALMECSVRLRAEISLRKEGERSVYWMDRWTAGINRALDELDASLPVEEDIGLVATACAALYLDLRHPSLEWRNGRPALAARVAQLQTTPHFAATDPQIPIAGSQRQRNLAPAQ